MIKATTNTEKPRAYSYLRFSTPEQERGDSFRRQTTAAQSYALRNGLELDATLTFQDLGVSAYRGANAETGRLGDFLAAVEKGVIPKGSYLLVESLDRLSRTKPRKAVRLLERICEAGIVLVTLTDGKVYTEDALDDDPLAFMMAFVIAMRANEESVTKGRRLRAAWANKRTRAGEHILTTRAPKWLRVVGSGKDRRFEVIKERADVVRRVFTLAVDGMGQNKIAETLNREKVPTFDGAKMWYGSIVSKWLRSDAAIGIYQPHTVTHEGSRKRRKPEAPVNDYYPPIIDKRTHAKVRALFAPGMPRAKHPAKGALSNVLAGLGRCALCGGTMTRVNKGYGGKGGKPYFACVTAKMGAGCQYHAVPQDEIEAAIIEARKDLQADAPPTDPTFNDLAHEIDLNLSAAEEAIENLIEEIRERGSSPQLRKALDDAEAKKEAWTQKSRELAQRMAHGSELQLRDSLEVTYEALSDPAKDVAKINTALRRLFTHATIDWRFAALDLHWRHAPGATMRVRYAETPRPRLIRGGARAA